MKYSELYKSERPCPFCEPMQQDKILENDSAYLTYALAPYHKDHLLVVPKRHIEHLHDQTHKELDDIYALEDTAWKLLQKLGYSSVSYIVREGSGSGRTVTHIHHHVIPEVRLGDLDHKGGERSVLTEEEVKATLERVRSIL